MLYSIFVGCPRSARAMSRTSPGVMWRRSARGCTVIPGAPAATQTSTASSTFGSRPPRELRSVATLFTLTLKRAAISPQPSVLSSEVLFDHIDDLLRPAADLVLPLPLEHHA